MPDLLRFQTASGFSDLYTQSAFRAVFQCYRQAVQRGNLLDDRQTQPATLGVLAGGAVEAFFDTGEVFGGDACAVVAHFDEAV